MMSVPQLRMGFRRFDELLPPRAVSGYSLRTYRPGDEEAWVAILQTGDFGTWDRARLDGMLGGNRGMMPQDGIFFATYEDRPVGTACTFVQPGEQGDVAEVGWVAVHPAHRGHGLGEQVCRAVLGFIRKLGHDYAYLKTEDFRVPAIKMYLRLGFEPEMVDPSHPAWWAALRRSLAAGDEAQT